MRLRMVWGLVAFVVGVAYGWLSPGQQPKFALLKTGVLAGLIVALVFALIGWLTDTDPLGFGVSYFGLFLSVVILTLVFVLGVWLGDLIERATHRGRTA